MIPPFRLLFAVVIIGNAIVFAGVDPVARAITAVAALGLVISLRNMPDVPRIHRAAAAGIGAVVLLQLIPLPHGLRSFLQPGFSEVLRDGWAPLSLAPWATLNTAAGWMIAAALALYAAHMATTRSGLPTLLMIIAGTGVVTAILGLLAEGSEPGLVLFVRPAPQHSAYGAFLNRNHFAQTMELCTPAAAVFLAAAWRRLPTRGLSRQKAAVAMLTAAVAVALCTTALVRSGSRGGLIFLVVTFVLTIPLWRHRSVVAKLWQQLAVVGAIVLVVGTLSWTRLPDIAERMSTLTIIEGMQGNSRTDLWRGTLASWVRAPIVGSGLGTYRYVIGMDKPATGAMVLEQAHNDWLEWLSTTGFLGFGALCLGVVGLVNALRPKSIRWLRSELRYPLAGAAAALVATALHEAVGFGLQTPTNRYLLAVWIGLIWGIMNRTQELRERSRSRVREEKAADEQVTGT